ncbi:DUF6622 family protein [Andreprevotia chitinilytica]|uniref:DUF6622 family protein n=1 Tax=Andreprevotia chitinilytica TaxID=396808 RepID=UPI00068F7C76|nr:DUF6622 family protein [Andreprevotia chitinilytica]
MFSQIISHTPVWVWLVLAFLIYRGLQATADRTAPLRKLFILPIVMLCLSLQGMIGHFGGQLAVWATWLAGVVVAVTLIIATTRPGTVHFDRTTGLVYSRGSWMPLVLMLAIFSTKYVTEVMMGMRPELASTPSFALCVAALYGVLIGFMPRTLIRIALQAARPAPLPLPLGRQV